MTYREVPLLSFSLLADYLEGPEYFRLRALGLHTMESTPDMDLGTHIHNHMQGRNLPEPVLQPSRASKEGKAMYVELEAAGTPMLPAAQHAKYVAITTSGYGNLAPWVEMLRDHNTYTELPVWLTITDAAGGKWFLKGCIDGYNPISGNLLDIKCSGLNKRAFERKLTDLTSMQLAIYQEALLQHQYAVSAVWVLRVNTSEPYIHGLYQLCDATLYEGLSLAKSILADIGQCIRKYGWDNPWPFDNQARNGYIIV
jgi:hypothetical protein